MFVPLIGMPILPHWSNSRFSINDNQLFRDKWQRRKSIEIQLAKMLRATVFVLKQS